MVGLLDDHGLYITHQKCLLFEDFKNFGKNLNDAVSDAIYEVLRNLELVLNSSCNPNYTGIEAMAEYSDL